jgi:hypothetical protein
MEFRSNSIEVGNRMKPSNNETVWRCKEGQALRCKIDPTFYQKIMLDIE